VEVETIVDTRNAPVSITKRKQKRSYTTIYRCEECTVEKKRPMWLCHTTKKIDGKDIVVSCHLKYHAQKEFLKKPVVLSVALFLI
jgi:hypothetical protein